MKDILLKGRFYLGFFLAGVIALVLVWAEERQDWFTAEACLVAILLLLALIIWDWWRTNHKCPPLSGEADVYSRATDKVLWCVAIGFTALILNANRWGHWEHGGVAKAIGYGVLVAGAFFIGGALFGYLFGLRPTGASQSPSSNSPSPPHTNLEEIADWLTKLILGAGLVELKSLRGPVKHFAIFMAHGVDIPDNPGSPAIALAIMSFFSASGVLYGYLWTRYQQALKGFPPVPDVTSPSEEAIHDRAA